MNSSATIRTWFSRPQRCARATRREADSSRDGGDYEAGAPSGAPVPSSLPAFLHLLLLQPLSNCSAVQPLLVPLSNYLLPLRPRAETMLFAVHALDPAILSSRRKKTLQPSVLSCSSASPAPPPSAPPLSCTRRSPEWRASLRRSTTPSRARRSGCRCSWPPAHPPRPCSRST